MKQYKHIKVKDLKLEDVILINGKKFTILGLSVPMGCGRIDNKPFRCISGAFSRVGTPFKLKSLYKEDNEIMTVVNKKDVNMKNFAIKVNLLCDSLDNKINNIK